MRNNIFSLRKATDLVSKTTVFVLLMMLFSTPVSAEEMSSPNGKITLRLSKYGMTLLYQNQKVIEIPSFGLGNRAELPVFHRVRTIEDSYEMIAGKQLKCQNKANEYAGTLDGMTTLVIRLYDDGLAFRYEYINTKHGPLPQEHTTYLIQEGTRRWMEQWLDSYEEFFPLSTTANIKAVKHADKSVMTPEGYNTRWAYPALLEPVDGVFALITEANIERKQSASCLYNDGETFRLVPDKNETDAQGSWHTPWRVVIVGTLGDIVESTLVTDVSEPNRIEDTSWIHPGTVSWIYWAYNHGSNDYDIICKYVDMAVALHLPYVLIDAEWDEMKDGKTIEDAVNYALQRGIKPMIWYNSTTGWIDGAPTPKYRLNKPEDREHEFAWCERIGVAGVKIDFFAGDDNSTMEYCIDLLESAARHHLLVNFHGASVPRGWQRTYPNLMSTEGVYGAEWYNNVPTFTEKAACHNATLPFTRNVVGPMDYTPCTFSDSQHPHITTHAHELALTVLFESALQHLADRPESYLAQPAEVRQFFGELPTVWDETRFVSGYPGESVVIARRSGSTWYVAGINGKDEEQTLLLPLDFIPAGKVTLFADGADWDIQQLEKCPTSIKCKPRGGFVMVISD